MKDIFDKVKDTLTGSTQPDLSGIPQDDQSNLFSPTPLKKLLVSTDGTKENNEFEDKEFIGLLKTTVLSGNQKSHNKGRDRVSSNADVVNNHFEKPNKHKSKYQKRLPSKSINAFNEFGL